MKAIRILLTIGGWVSIGLAACSPVIWFIGFGFLSFVVGGDGGLNDIQKIIWAAIAFSTLLYIISGIIALTTKNRIDKTNMIVLLVVSIVFFNPIIIVISIIGLCIINEQEKNNYNK
ncbi:MAG: hypothetical protein IJS83_04505 [Acholeplasmatales bacterium]|nr:hypothetical protein [Acholeplasmatales bacterium]